MPAISIGSAYCGGWEDPIKDAKVPHSMMGKTGRVHAGVMFWIVRGLPVKRKKYCPTAQRNVIAAYVQKKTRIVTINQYPQ